jgi:hypothetical protein
MVVMVAACGGQTSASKSPTTAPVESSEPHSGEVGYPVSLGAARTELETAELDVKGSLADCHTACKALASFERAMYRVCLLAEPVECGEARVRFEQAHRIVISCCNGC